MIALTNLVLTQARAHNLKPTVVYRREQWPIPMLQELIRKYGRCIAPWYTLAPPICSHAHTRLLQEPCLVIDMFARSHATTVAARTCGCYYLGIDVDPESVRVGEFHVPRMLARAEYKVGSALFGT